MKFGVGPEGRDGGGLVDVKGYHFVVSTRGNPGGKNGRCVVLTGGREERGKRRKRVNQHV